MNHCSQQGFAALYLTLLVVAVLGGVSASGFFLISDNQRIIRNAEESVQAYYGAEAGIEDALFRTKNSLSWANPGSLGVLDAEVSVTITDEGATKIVVAEGNDSSRIRKVRAVYQEGTTPQFFYGAHVGAGGVVMESLSRVEGNVFSNGNVDAGSGTEITNTVIVAGTGGKIDSATIGGDAHADICDASDIAGTLHANSPGECTYASFSPLGDPPNSVPLPISEQQILDWKADAEAGGVTGSINLDGDDTLSIGPQKIAGNLTVQNQAILTLTGTLWVTGNVDVKNSAQVRLDSSFGSMSGVLVTDGVITLQNNSVSSGSGASGSYLMYLSTNSGDPALIAKNNAVADIIYTSAGWVEVQNNQQLKQVTGYGITLKNNATITYEIGLQDASFTSGPGIGWELVSWKEVE